MLKRIFSYMRQYKKYAYLALLCIGIEAVLELMFLTFIPKEYRWEAAPFLRLF